MITVVGVWKGEKCVPEKDDWIPLKVTWFPRPASRLLYLRVSGERGGELELKVDADTGRLVQVIVIETPPLQDWSPPSAHGASSAPQLVPVIDRASWTTSNDVGEAQRHGGIARIVEPLSFTSTARYTRLAFTERASASRYRCGSGWVGVTDDQALAEIVVLWDLP